MNMAKPRETVLESKPRRTGLVTFFRESWLELKRVRWPGRKEVINYTAASLLVSVIMGLLVWGFDVGVSKLMSLIGLV